MSLCTSLPSVYIRPLYRNADTDFILVFALNQTDKPQTLTISVQNYQDTCETNIYPLYGYLCGELINNDNGGSDDEVRSGDGNGGCIYCEPEGVNSFIGSVTFTIPPRQLFSVRGGPQDLYQPVDPHYVVRVTI